MNASTQAQTLTTALRSVVGPSSWASGTFHTPRRVHTFAFAVAPAVVVRALVHV